MNRISCGYDSRPDSHLYACAADYAAIGALGSGARHKVSNIGRAKRSSLVYRGLMLRFVCLSIAVVLSLLAVVAQAEPIHKRPKPVWHGYGFLPGYHQPPSNSQPLDAQKDAVRRSARQNRRPWYIDPTPRYYGYDGEWHYVGRPGFYGGHYNGGTFGPCWTRTPIGPVWNCG